MPIYPDEIAFRVQTGRYVQDNGIFYNIYSFCESNFKKIPFLLAIPAYLISVIDINFNLVQFRIFQFILILSITGLLILITKVIANKKEFNIAVLYISSVFIGVAGSGLVLARHELIIELNTLIWLLSFFYIIRKNNNKYLSILLAILNLLASFASIYIHPQGLLWVPLSFLFSFFLLEKFYKFCPLIVSHGGLFIATVITSIKFNKFKCNEAVEILNFINGMKVNFANISFKTVSVFESA
jgi:hypothetical protein